MQYGTAASRPASAAANEGMVWYATDTKELSRDNGSTWDSLGIVHLTIGADDHHAQSHSLGSHSSEAHSELTGVGVNDHHAEVSQADQAALEAETNENTYVPPDLVRHNPGVAKAYGNVAADGTLGSGSYNITSSVKDSTGVYTITFDDDFADTNYVVMAITTVVAGVVQISTKAAGTVAIRTFDDDGSSTGADRDFNFVCFGDQ